jgi:hypothetical protein
VSLAFSAIVAIISAATLWIAILRYRREVVNKRISYFVKSSKDNLARFYVWNSGNAPIEQEDYISSSLGFEFGNQVTFRDVSVEYQAPHDLGVNVTVVDSVRLEIPKLVLNPGDGFTVQVLIADSEVKQKPRPYGRIRGTHELFKEEKPEVKEFGKVSSFSTGTRRGLPAIIVLALALLLLSLYTTTTQVVAGYTIQVPAVDDILLEATFTVDGRVIGTIYTQQEPHSLRDIISPGQHDYELSVDFWRGPWHQRCSSQGTIDIQNGDVFHVYVDKDCSNASLREGEEYKWVNEQGEPLGRS